MKRLCLLIAVVLALSAPAALAESNPGAPDCLTGGQTTARDFGPIVRDSHGASVSVLGDRPVCTNGSPVRFAGYRYAKGVQPPAAFEDTLPQTLLASSDGNGRTWRIDVCADQLDLFHGDTLDTVDGQHQYDDRLIRSDNAAAPCPPPPPPSTTSTTAAASTTTAAAPPSSVAETVVTAAPCATGVTCELARTGSDAGLLAALGVLSIVVGVVVRVAADRRRWSR